MTHRRKRSADEPHECSKACAPRPGDERGAYSRKQLERMDDRFVRALQREERSLTKSAARGRFQNRHD